MAALANARRAYYATVIDYSPYIIGATLRDGGARIDNHADNMFQAEENARKALQSLIGERSISVFEERCGVVLVAIWNGENLIGQYFIERESVRVDRGEPLTAEDRS
jgi:hypothetical protein